MTTPTPVKLSCDMVADCPTDVTHIDEKGYTYCTPHGESRRGTMRCRRMTKPEITQLESGLTIWYDPERNL